MDFKEFVCHRCVYTSTHFICRENYMPEQRYANTEAAHLLATALRRASQEQGLSLREIGRRLGYKQPVVLSHMASGRVPIPTDRAVDIAREVGATESVFLEAVLRQHHPSVNWGLITGQFDPILEDLQRSTQTPLKDLSAEHRRVLREVCKDSRPAERWIATSEIAALKLMRELFPQLSTVGLSADDSATLRTCVQVLKDADNG